MPRIVRLFQDLRLALGPAAAQGLLTRPWYHTTYTSEGARGGRYGGSLFANSAAHAKRVAKRRGLGEVLDDAMPSNKRPYVLPSERMRKGRTPANDKRTFHALCWMAHLALRSNAATVDELLQNQKDGCPRCRRFRHNLDGTETEYRLKAH